MSRGRLATRAHPGNDPGRARTTPKRWAPDRDRRRGSVVGALPTLEGSVTPASDPIGAVLGGSASRIGGGRFVRRASGRELAGSARSRA
jgi:hypothetical protein